MTVVLEGKVQLFVLWLKLPSWSPEQNLNQVIQGFGSAGPILKAVNKKSKEENIWVQIFRTDKEFSTKLDLELILSQPEAKYLFLPFLSTQKIRCANGKFDGCGSGMEEVEKNKKKLNPIFVFKYPGLPHQYRNKTLPRKNRNVQVKGKMF
ncbi:hypothetical protein ACET3Z_018608 [Daucus carota]